MNDRKGEPHLSVSLKEHFERILAEYKESVAMALAIRTTETDRRLDILNNHADRVDDILEKCLPRTEWDIHHLQLKEKVLDLEKFKIVVDTKANQSSLNWSFALSAISTLLAIIAIIHEFTK